MRILLTIALCMGIVAPGIAISGSQKPKFDVSALMHPGTWTKTTTGAFPRPTTSRTCVTTADLHDFINRIYAGAEQTVTLDKIKRHGNSVHYVITALGTGDFKGYKAKIVGGIVFADQDHYRDTQNFTETLAPGMPAKTSKVTAVAHRVGSCGSS